MHNLKFTFSGVAIYPPMLHFQIQHHCKSLHTLLVQAVLKVLMRMSVLHILLIQCHKARERESKPSLERNGQSVLIEWKEETVMK